jgi:hypothetical protein
MIKTLTPYPGAVNYLLTRASHLPPPPPPPPAPRDPLALPAKGASATQRFRTRHQISHSIANPSDSQFQVIPALGHMRIQWHYPTSEPTRHRARLHTFIITAVPMLFIVAIAFVAGCLAAILETSFGQ